MLPHVPARQWLLSVPKRLRPYLHYDTEVASAVLRILLRAIRTTLRRASRGAPPDAQTGAVSFFHRFGSSLNAHPHYHLVMLDGVFSENEHGELRFHEASELTPERAQAIESLLQRRILRWFHRRGLLDEADTYDMLSWQGSGGFSVDASVRIDGDDRTGIERLVRYCARPPFALERLHALDGTAALASNEASLLYRLPRPDLDGRTELLLTPLELLERLARFVPPPRVHRHRYHGALAPNAKWRSAVAALGRPESRALAPGEQQPDPASPPTGPGERRRPASPARIR